MRAVAVRLPRKVPHDSINRTTLWCQLSDVVFRLCGQSIPVD
jgi:hypothetical protein